MIHRNTSLGVGKLANTVVKNDKAEPLIKSSPDKAWKLVRHHELPDWLQDNTDLHLYHRPAPFNSARLCLKSILKLHSETGNIWTHLLGSIAYLLIGCRYMTLDVEWQEKLVFSAFFAGAVLCMGFSWVFHTFMCHSADVKCACNKLDYSGVIILNIGTFIPTLYYTFYWKLHLMKIYLAIIICTGVTTVIILTHDALQQPQFRSLRAGVFVALGLQAVVPVCHYVALEGVYSAVHVAAHDSLILMAVMYITGACIYACRVPEKWWPGKFDLWFNSHQIMHVFVVLGASVSYHGLLRMSANRLREVQQLQN